MDNDSFNRRMELINVLVIHILFLGFNLNNLNQNEYFFFNALTLNTCCIIIWYLIKDKS